MGRDKVELFAAIRDDHRQLGLGIRALARKHGVHRRTVREALASSVPAPRKAPVRRSPVREMVAGLVDAMLAEDLDAPRKQRPRALTSYLGLSVGGTLSVGGLDGGSFAYGAQVDNVLRLELVTGAGQHLNCSPDQHPDLFRATLAGLGQCAIIVNATIPLVPADPSVREYQLFYPDLPSMLADARAMAAEARFHRVILFIAPGPDLQQTFSISAARFFTPPAGPSDHHLLGGLGHLTDQTVIKDTPFLDFADRVRPPQSAFNPWLDIMVPASNAAPLTDSITGLLQQASRDTGTAMPLVVLAVLTSATLRQPLLRAPAEGDLFIIDVQQSTDSAGAAARIEVPLVFRTGVQ